MQQSEVSETWGKVADVHIQGSGLLLVASSETLFAQ